MQRRGWILIVALVLGMAAVTASLAPAPSENDADEPEVARTVPGRTLQVSFNAARPASREVARGTHVVLGIEVPRAGEVRIDGLGLSAAAEPGTPAVFDILAERSGRFEVTFTPVEGEEPRRAGTLTVR